MSNVYHHDPAFLKAVETLIQTIQFDVNGTAGKGGNGGLTSDKAIRQSGELNIMMDRIKKQEALAAQPSSQAHDAVERMVLSLRNPFPSENLTISRGIDGWREIMWAAHAAAAPAAIPEIKVQDVCPICIEAFNVGDILRPRRNAPGPVHAECLEDKPDVDQETGEIIRDTLATFVYEGHSSLANTQDDAAQFDSADFYWRTMDPDDSGDYPQEAINRAGLGPYCIAEIASSFTGPRRFGFIAPVLELDSDEEEFLHFATEAEALDAAKLRRLTIELREAERESYVNADGAPLKHDEPIPAPFSWKPDHVG